MIIQFLFLTFQSFQALCGINQVATAYPSTIMYSIYKEYFVKINSNSVSVKQS